MTLPEVLSDALRRVRHGAIVTVSREGEHAYQLKILPDRAVERGWYCLGRRWVSETRPGTEYEGWSRWSNFLGFGVEAAIADDWKILVVEES